MVFNQLFKAIKKRLIEQVADIAEVRWEMGQADTQRGEMVVSNLVTVRMLETDMSDFLSDGVQYGVVSFDIRLLSDHVGADDAERMEAHYTLAGQINDALAGFGCNLGYALNNADTRDLCGTISRMRVVPEHRADALIRTVQRFSCMAYDYTGEIATATATPEVLITPNIAP